MNRTDTRAVWLGALMALLAGWAPLASALTGHIVTTVQVHAGPSTEYPRVTVLRPGAVLQVHGCEQGYGWCDVEFGHDRGWVDAAYVQADATSGPVIVASAGATLGVPITAFDLDSYWRSHYRGQPWYAHRERFLKYWKQHPHGQPPPPPRAAQGEPDTGPASEAAPAASTG